MLEFSFDGLELRWEPDLEPSDFHCSLQELLCVEVFAGCAQLSSSLRETGFAILPIDHMKGKVMKAKLMILDLTKQADIEVLINVLCTANIAYCHCAPVCGTGSRAREIPLPVGMEKFNARPLRSQQWPLGLPDLEGTDKLRVQAANQLYFLTLCIAMIAYQRGFVFSVENPSNAYFWLAMQTLADQFPQLSNAWFSNESTHFQTCAHGGERDKWTCWYGTAQVFTALRARCTHEHPKDAWRPYLDSSGKPIFPTKAESAYPELLCQKVATLVKQEALQRGAIGSPPAYLAMGKPEETRASKRFGWATLPPLVAEYKLVTDQCPDKDTAYKEISTMPKWQKKGEEDQLGARGTKIEVSDSYNMGDPLFGVYRSPLEFVEAALQAKHPIDFACNIPDVLTKNVARVLSDGPKLVVARRKLAVLKARKLVQQLQSQEAQLHASLHPEMAKLLEGKNLLAWKVLMEETGFEDPTLFEELTQGFKLVGQAKVSPQFPRGFASMQQSPAELQQKAIWMRKANAAKCKPSGRPELDQLVWQQTMEEKDSGWLQGPFSEDEISQMVGSPNWLAARRFPLEQKDKVRLIDDALASGLNSAYGTSNKLVLFDVDTLVALSIQIAKALANPKDPLLLMDGTVVNMDVSKAWSRPFRLVGRTLDLQSAYKQIGPYMDHLWNRVIMVYNPDLKGPSFFISSALMFGSTAAVYAFNRVSRSIWHILTHQLNLWMTVYYDDFPILEPEETAASADECIAEMLDLLGWRFARSGKKAIPFSPTFDVLGVTVDLQHIAGGEILLKNKDSRVATLTSSLDDLLNAGKLEPAVASSLHGQFNFAQGQFLGSPMKPAMQFFSKIANQGWSDELRPELAVSCLYAKSVLMHEEPRSINIHGEQRPILVFTDGAWEPTSQHPAGAGVVLVDPVSGTRVAHEVVVPSELIEHWKSMGKAQLIAELELLPVVVFFEVYAKLCQRRRVLLFVDNNAVRDSIAKASSKSLTLLILLSELHRPWSQIQCLCWVSRVPTRSNIGDLPSRQLPAEAARIIGGVHLPDLVPSEML